MKINDSEKSSPVSHGIATVDLDQFKSILSAEFTPLLAKTFRDGFIWGVVVTNAVDIAVFLGRILWEIIAER